jgi:lactate dehydrogenase-like 2-hydroxyacid dehydrogenase
MAWVGDRQLHSSGGTATRGPPIRGFKTMAERPAIFVTRKLPDAVTARLLHNYRATLNPEDGPISGPALAAGAVGHDALLISSRESMTAETLAALPDSIRAIATFSVGFEHIDLPAAKARGLVVTNTPDVLTDATADIAMLLILGAARRAGEGERMVRNDRWAGLGLAEMLGLQVSGKRLGIFGMGRIGRALARRARGFDMTIHYCNRKRLTPELEQGALFHADPEAMLPHCDVLSLNCPASAETRRFLNAQRIARLPDGAIVVNSSRGAIVDDDALIAALRSNKLFAAGLDVYENEPRIHPDYRTLPNVFLLPHLGSATVETRNAMGFKCLDNLDAIFAGRPPPDRLV